MKCKDIDERPILEFVRNLNDHPIDEGPIYCSTATWFRGFNNSVPMPEGTPENLIIAKMAQMIKKGVLDGCPCGCRGDYEITDKGREELERLPPAKKVGE